MNRAVPTVSIVIPAYNHADYLPQAVDSLIAQRTRPEIIVLDDGSTDHTREVLARYNGCIHWESKRNTGQAATLNRGWAMASGEFLGYLSADDLLYPDAVGQMLEALRANGDAVAAYPDFDLIDPGGRVVRAVSAPDFELKAALLGNECLPGPGALFRRDAFERAGGWNPDYRQMPDYDFWLRLGMLGRFVHVRRVLAGFRVHPGSQTYAAATPARACEPLAIIRRALDHPALPTALQPLRDEAMANAWLFSAQLHLRALRFAEGWTAAWAALRLHPASVLSLRGIRLLTNALLNRVGHLLLWRLRGLNRRRSASS